MNRFIGSLLAISFAVAIGPTAALATTAKCPAGETYTKAYTKSDGTKVSGYCSAKGTKTMAAPKAMASPKAMATGMKAMASPKAMATGMKAMASPAAMSSGMKSAGSMSSAAGASSCPAGKTYVNGYTKSNGTKVAGYCRSKPSSSK